LIGACRDFSNSRGFVPIIAEDSRNLAELIESPPKGMGLDGVWSDDFHHQLRVMLAGDRDAYFAEFQGTATDLVETITNGWFYRGQRTLSGNEVRGTDPSSIERFSHFVFAIQNHDQVGNRAFGERLHHQIELGSYKAASALLLLVAETPLLFMGQEWAASSPFLYFTDHKPDLGLLVERGRRQEFAGFQSFSDPEVRQRIPSPQAPATFIASRLRWSEIYITTTTNTNTNTNTTTTTNRHSGVLAFYRKLLHLRREEPALSTSLRSCSRCFLLTTQEKEPLIALVRSSASSTSTIVAIFRLKGKNPLSVVLSEERCPLSEFFARSSRVELICTSDDLPFRDISSEISSSSSPLPPPAVEVSLSTHLYSKPTNVNGDKTVKLSDDEGSFSKIIFFQPAVVIFRVSN